MIAIRTADVQDESALASIDIATWNADVTPAPPREPQRPFFDERTRPEDVFVADGDGRVVGYVLLQQSIPLPSHAHVLTVNGLAVDPVHHGRGLGRRLVEEAQREAQRRGARKLSLRVLSTNDSARRLYESCGFEVEGVLRGEFVLRGQLVDDVLMSWHPR